jgi:uncharacterized protein YkwD
MKRVLLPSLFIFISIIACALPGMSAPAPIPTMDLNILSTAIVETAQAAIALSMTPTNLATDFPTETPTPLPTATLLPTETPIPTATIMPVIGEAIIMMPFAIDAPAFPSVSAVIVEADELTARADCPETDSALEARVIEFINAERAKAGLNTLTAQEQLTDAARLHSADMACHDYFAHTALDGASGGDRVTRAGYVWKYYGENIAAGYASPYDVVQAWMKSPSHKANALGKYYVEVGVGYAYAKDSAYGSYWTILMGQR